MTSCLAYTTTTGIPGHAEIVAGIHAAAVRATQPTVEGPACPATRVEPHLAGEFPMDCYPCHVVVNVDEGPLPSWMSEAGEPLMTAAELRFEAELDAESAQWNFEDFEYVGPEPDGSADPETCAHLDADQVDDATSECLWCGTRYAYDWKS